MARIHMNNLVNHSYRELYHDICDAGHRHYWLSGGRGSGKSSFVSLMIVFGMLCDKSANALCLRRTANTLWDSVYKQMIWALDTLGQGSNWRCTKTPMEIVHRETGQRILFRGSDDPQKIKSIRLGKGYFGYLWFEELTEFRGMDDIRSILQSLGRGTDRFQAFYSYNPPKSAQNWVNSEALVPHEGRLFHKSDYRDMPPQWLGQVFLEEAENLRAINERSYRNVYLGEVTGTGGQVFDNVVLESMHTNSSNHNGLDFGFAVDPAALVRCHYARRSQRLYILDEVYGTHLRTATLAERCKALCGAETIVCDSSDPRTIAELREYGVLAIPCRKGPGSREHGIRWLQDRAAIVIDPKRCPNTAREFLGYEYKQDRFGNFLAEAQDHNDHTIDAVRYAIEDLATARTATTIKREVIGL